MNLADSDEPGTHWTVFRIIPSKRGEVIYYADPFGTSLGGFAPRELTQLGLPIVENSVTFQRPDTALCGYYAVIWARMMDEMPQVSRKRFEQLLMESIA